MKKTTLVWAGLSVATVLGVTASVAMLPVLAQRGEHPKSNATRVRARGATPLRQDAIKESQNLAVTADEAWRRDGDFKKAEQLFNNALALNDSNPFTKIAFAQMLSEKGRISEAFEQYQNAVHPSPLNRQQGGFFDPSTLARYMDLSRKADAEGVPGAADEAIWAARETVLTASQSYPDFPTYVEEDLSSLPVSALAELAIGLSQERAGDNKKALATFQSVAKRYPNLALAHLYVGRGYEHTIGWGATPAKEAYRNAIALGDAKVTAAAKKALK